MEASKGYLVGTVAEHSGKNSCVWPLVTVHPQRSRECLAWYMLMTKGEKQSIRLFQKIPLHRSVEPDEMLII